MPCNGVPYIIPPETLFCGDVPMKCKRNCTLKSVRLMIMIKLFACARLLLHLLYVFIGNHTRCLHERRDAEEGIWGLAAQQRMPLTYEDIRDGCNGKVTTIQYITCSNVLCLKQGIRLIAKVRGLINLMMISLSRIGSHECLSQCSPRNSPLIPLMQLSACTQFLKGA